MDIHVKLFRHQKELVRSQEDIVYLRCGRG